MEDDNFFHDVGASIVSRRMHLADRRDSRPVRGRLDDHGLSKAKLVAEKVANLTRVDVDTTNRVVSLNGIVQSPDQKKRAEELALQVSGVTRVQNNLQIQKIN
jgi:osmotically-inducible protein OsmY